MRWSQLHIPTLRDTPAGVEAVHDQLLLRAGYVRPSGQLFLAARSLRKIAAIVREEMDAIGAQEIRLLDGQNADALARGEIRSYKQLPQIWYQLREQWQADSYTLALDDASDKLLREGHRRILTRCGLPFLEGPHGYFVVAAGGDQLAATSKSGYAARRDLAVARPPAPAIADPEGDLEPSSFHTPGQKTIADVSAFTGLPFTSQMKSLVMVADAKPYLLLMRGDHSLSVPKFQAFVAAKTVRPAHPAEIEEWFGAAPGSLGPLGVTNMPVIADDALRDRRNMICGANRDDFHMRNVTPGEDFNPQWGDLRLACEGDTDVETGEPLEFVKTIEAGCAAKQTSAIELRVLDESGKETPVVVGCHSLHVERILHAAAALFHDANGLCLPRAIAPFDVVITPVNMSDAAQRIYEECKATGIDTLLDDRDERPGVKFKDADLIGVPWRVTIGKKLAEGKVELVERRTRETRDVEIDRIVEALNT